MTLFVLNSFEVEGKDSPNLMHYHNWLLMQTDIKDNGFQEIATKYPDCIYDKNVDYQAKLEEYLDDQNSSQNQ